MKRLNTLFFLSFFIVVFVASCSGLQKPQRKIAYYSLEYDPPLVKTWEPLSTVIRIDPFQMSPIYHANKMVFAERPYRIDEYNYHKWRATPGDLVTYFLTRDFKASSLFKAVSSHVSESSGSHAIEGMVEEFFEQDAENGWEAVLTVSISLLAENIPSITQGILLQKRYSLREKCRQKNPGALAEAMSRAMAGISEMIISDVYHAVAVKTK